MFGAPESVVDLLILPAICVAFSLLLRLGAWGRDRSGGGATWLKVASLVPALFGLYIGGQNLWAMFNPDTGFLYVKTIVGKKVLLGHYVSFLLPLFTLIGILIWGRIEKKLGRPLAI